VRQWQLLGGQHDFVSERRLRQRRCGLGQPLCQIDGEANPALGIERQDLLVDPALEMDILPNEANKSFVINVRPENAQRSPRVQ